MDTIIEEIRKRIKARMDNTNAAGDYDEYADGQGVGLAAALRIIDEVEKDHTVPSDVQEASRNYADKRLLENKRELAESGHTRHFKMGYVGFAGYEIEEAFADGMLAERERLMKDAVEIDTDITINRYTKQHILHISSTDEHIQHLPKGEYKAIIIKKEK